MFDWSAEDVWHANYLFGYDYNHLYDLYYMAGLKTTQMRVASPFNDYSKDSLNLYRVIDPQIWVKLVGRVNGANFASIYGRTKAMGYRNVTLQEGHTWESYTRFLLETLPKRLRNNYARKFNTSIIFWHKTGGGLDEETIHELLDHGYYPDGFLTPPSNEAMKFDVETVKNMGFNMLRKHIKIEPLLWYHYCDVNGILVWQDMVNGGGKYGLEISVLQFIGITLDDTRYETFARTDENCRALYYEELHDMVDYLYNCPCIAMWVPFNEGWGQFDSKVAYDLVKTLDKTRVIDCTSGWHDRGYTDVTSKHIYFTPIKVKAGDKPYVLSEFGGYSQRIKGHTFNDKMFGYKIYHTKQALTKAYSNCFNKTIIPQLKTGLSATVYTQVTDVEDELNGIMTYDREVIKLDIDILKKINERMKY